MDFDFSKEPGKELIKRDIDFDGNPLISIITPYYNAGKYFRQTVNSVLNQTFPYFEWIIVNDGSTNKDDIKMLEDIPVIDKRIRVLHFENHGPSVARNIAIKSSQTEIIVTLDADDLIEPTYLECIYWALYCNPDASWCYSDSLGFGEQRYTWKMPFNLDQLKEQNFLTYCAGIRKKDLIEVNGYSETEKHFYEDWELWLKLIAHNKFPIHMGWYGFWYRRSENGNLGTVKNDSTKHDLAMKIIKDTSQKIKRKIFPIEYPRIEKTKFEKPIKWEWERNSVSINKKTKILMIIPWMVMGGADLFNLDFVSRINKEEFEVSILTTVVAESVWRQRFAEHVQDIFELPSFLDVKNWSAFIHYFIKSRNIDIVFISNSYYGYYLAPWLRKEFPEIPIVDYVHMEEWYWRAGGYARTSGALSNIIDKTYVCNEHLRNVMVNHFAKNHEDVQTIYIGVDENEFDPEQQQKGVIKSKFNIDQNRPVVLFPCRIHPQKRPFLMLELAKETRSYIPNISFIVVGDGPQLEELKQKVYEEGLEKTVYFAGRQKDMMPFYKDADVTLICSIKEGLALTAYESLSMEVPVISADVGGQKELVSEDVGKLIPLLQREAEDFDARFFNKEEIAQYVKAIVDILSIQNDGIKLRKNCRIRIKNGFTRNQMINCLEEEFMELKNGRGKEKREQIASALKVLTNLADDYLTIFNEYYSKDRELEEIWKANLYFRRLIESNNESKMDGSEQINNFAYLELQQIYNMRTWKLIKKYIYIMDNTRIGKILCGIRYIIFRMLGK